MTQGINPFDEVTRVEAALRDLIRLRLGSSWMDTAGLSDDAIDKIERRLSEDHKRRSGARLPSDRLDYTELSQLAPIMTRNWTKFSDVLGQKKHFDLDLSRLISIRNVVAHTRQLLPFEEHLLAGIGGQMRNKIAIYRSTMDETTNLWPTLESVTDSFGSSVSESGLWMPPSTTVTVGDTVTFRCKATDPENKDLQWLLSSPGSECSMVGEDATLVWNATDSDIGYETAVSVRLVSDRSHHRYDGISDAYVYFRYTVLPYRAT